MQSWTEGCAGDDEYSSLDFVRNYCISNAMQFDYAINCRVSCLVHDMRIMDGRLPCWRIAAFFFQIARQRCFSYVMHFHYVCDCIVTWPPHDMCSMDGR